MATLLSCDSEPTVAPPLSFGGSTTAVQTMSENSNAGVGGGAQQDALLLLQTVQEDRVCDLGTGDLDHSGRGTGFTRPASFSVGEGSFHHHHPHHHHHQTSAAHTSNRIRTMSYDRDLPRLVSNDDEPTTTLLRSFPLLSMPAAVANNNTFRVGSEITGKSNESNDSGFPPLFRRRTFTDAAEGNGSVRGGGRGPAGRVSVSVSEDNMLALLAKHLGGPVPTLLAESGHCGESPASARVGTSEVPASRAGKSRFDVGAADAWRNPPKSAAVARARRNTFVMRLHRVGLVEDASRCVMDIVEGRAARTGGRVEGLADDCALPKTTLEEVKAHFQSLPQRYTLSVEPEDVLTHMSLLAEAAHPSSGVRVVVYPPPLPFQSEAVPSGGGCVGGSAEGGGGEQKGGRLAVTVVCRHSPFLLGAVSRSLQAVGGACLDADVMTTTGGISMARLEVECDSTIDSGSCSPPRGILARTQGPDVPNGVPPHTRHENVWAVSHEPALHPLGDFLTSSIAQALALEESGDVGCFSGGDSSDGSDAHPAPCKKARATATEDDGIGSPTPAYPLETLGSSPDTVTRGTTSTTKKDDTERGAVTGEASDHVPQPVSPLGENHRCGCSVSLSSAQGDPHPPGRQGANNIAASGRRRREKLPLARRAGCTFLAETDGNAFSGNAVSSGGVGGDNDDVYGDCIASEDIELLELVGEGRFSRTHRARWRGKTVAVKMVELPAEEPEVGVEGVPEAWRAELAARTESRRVMLMEFERELEIVRKLKHPSICAYRGVCIASSRLSLVYEFLENGTLGDRLRYNHCQRPSAATGAPRIGAYGCGNASGASAFGAAAERSSFHAPSVLPPLGDADLLRIAEDVVGGMRYLHEMGILHRDLKPDNILLDADDRARIADFGLSCPCRPSKEHTAETGTYRWMAPEVIRHEPYDQAADVYSFGMVLWEVLTRQQPFEGLTPIQAAFAVARQRLRPKIPPGAPPALTALIQRCWHPVPDARPSFTQISLDLPEIKHQTLGGVLPGGGYVAEKCASKVADCWLPRPSS